MVDHNLLKDLEISDEQINAQIQEAFGDTFEGGQMDEFVAESMTDFDPNSILKAKVIRLVGNDVILDVGLKSEGVVDKGEWDDASKIMPGDEVQVLLDEVEADTGMVLLSKRRADRILNWRRIVETCEEGDQVKGRVLRKIKGGLLVDIGVPVFLPASQVDIRRPATWASSSIRRSKPRSCASTANGGISLSHAAS